MTQERYSGTAILLHWLIAAALAFQFGLGEALEHLPRGPKQLDGRCSPFEFFSWRARYSTSHGWHSEQFIYLSIKKLRIIFELH